MSKYILLLVTVIKQFLLSVPDTHSVSLKPIENITEVQQVVWRNEKEVLLVKDGDIWVYDISNNALEHMGRRGGNEFVGLNEEGEVVLCSFEHFLISSEEEYSTKFTVYGKDLFFFETIRPIYFNGRKIVAVTAMDFMLERYFEIEVDSGNMVEIEKKERSLDINIPKGIQVRNVYVYSKDKYILEDIFGNLFLYQRISSKFSIVEYVKEECREYLDDKGYPDYSKISKCFYNKYIKEYVESS